MNGEPWWTKYALLVAGWLLGLFAKELSERISVLVRGPKLVVEFGDGEDCLTLTPEEHQEQINDHSVTVARKQRLVFFARIRVTNAKPRMASRCQAWLVNVESQDDAGQFRPTVFKDSIPLIWSYNAEIETVDIPQGINRYVDLARVRSDVDGFQPQLRSHSGEVLFPLRYGPLFTSNGIFRLTVLVSAQDVKPQQIKIVLSWDGAWPPRAELDS